MLLFFFKETTTYATPPEINICTLNPSYGQCSYRLTRYFYNSTVGQCQKFTWSGCDGNPNRFSTTQACMNTCGANTTLITKESLDCHFMPATGPCKGKFLRYYYNFDSSNCQQFIYGGCGGNRNNFQNYDRCMSTCSMDKCYNKVGYLNNATFHPNSHMPCTTCRCTDQKALQCHNITCGPPPCSRYERVQGTCCKVTCLEVGRATVIALIVIAITAVITIVSIGLWVCWLRNQTIKVGDASDALIGDDVFAIVP
ncbi:Boophilin-H2 [Trichoplax sp. H2]|nr:Boophilin-H2 [Trichoplax sp. H2]|eukprot:RDD38047.1 Boophilin-H2 [Trichoplax sp. H2]